MQTTLVPLADEHRVPAMDVINHYIENSDAAYPERPLPYEVFGQLLKMAEGYPAYAALAPDGAFVGFGMLRPYHPFPTFLRTAEVSYFLHPDFCRCGIGGALLARLLKDGAEMGIATVLASVTATNEASLAFHRRQGFVECGRFRSVLRKNGRNLDVVWLQKMLSDG